MKKLLSILLAVLLLQSSAMALTVSGVNEFPIVEEPYELTIMACVNANIDSWKDNTTMRAYEEKTGIKVNWIELNDQSVVEQIRLALISGGTPDIVLFYFNDTSMIQSFGAEGTIIPLNDLINDYTYYAKEQLEQNPHLKDLVTSTDGNIYTLWRMQARPHAAILNKQFVFLPWLAKYTEATGKGMPGTLNEYRALLEYFRDNDMNGNGDTTDEIVLLGNNELPHEGSSCMGYVMSAFQLWNCANFYHVTGDGELVFEANTTEFRDGLRYLNGMYKDGLYPEDDFILSLADFRSITNAVTPEEITVGVAAAPYYLRFITQSIFERAYDDFEAIPPLKNYYNSNVHETLQSYDAQYYLQAFICNSCEHPEIAIKWLDYWLSEDGLQHTDLFGIEGRDWEWTNEFESLAGNKPSILFKRTLTNTGNRDVAGCIGVPIYYDKDMFEATAVDPNSKGRNYNEWRSHMVYSPYAVKSNVPEITWCSDEDILVEYAELKTTLEEYVRASYSSFILGKIDINSDEDWQNYLDGLEERGLSTYLDIVKTILNL